jgi:choline dehydrogenase-like flavoprotein
MPHRLRTIEGQLTDLMIADARQVTPNSSIACDICVVGAGAAGITLANELQKSGSDVVLLESGGTSIEASTQDLYKGEVDDPRTHGPLDFYRQRRFGGTTVVWGGRCAPFDDIDFASRPYVRYSGWPIGKSDLDLYYLRAHAYCDLGAYAYCVCSALPNGKAQMIPGFQSADVRTDRLWRFSRPTNFAKTFGGVLRRSPNVRVYLHANCLGIHTLENGAVVDHLKVASSPNKRFTVTARKYVLATGGLEVTRLLLISDDVHPTGIGNSSDLLGRFYLSHVSGDLGEILFTPTNGQVVWNYEKTLDQVYCLRFMSISEDKQRHDQLLNFRATLSHPPVGDPRHHNGVLSVMYLIKRHLAHRIPPEYSKALSGMTPLTHVSAHLANVLKDSRNVASFSSMWVRERLLKARKLPSAMFENESNVYTIHVDAEQSPNPDSRVMLSDTRDAFGMKRLRVKWKLNDADVLSIIKSCHLISQALEHGGTGQMLFDPDLMAAHIQETCSVGSHHIGTTRMGNHPSLGVVDKNCRVYGTRNLFIASSSVFPTSGASNPTLTIVALAIRLADHLQTSQSTKEVT